MDGTAAMITHATPRRAPGDSERWYHFDMAMRSAARREAEYRRNPWYGFRNELPEHSWYHLSLADVHGPFMALECERQGESLLIVTSDDGFLCGADATPEQCRRTAALIIRHAVGPVAADMMCEAFASQVLARWPYTTAQFSKRFTSRAVYSALYRLSHDPAWQPLAFSEVLLLGAKGERVAADWYERHGCGLPLFVR